MSARIFFVPASYAAPDDARYEHNLLALAEGLEQLGIPYDAESSYWRLQDGTYFIKERRNNLLDILSIISHESYPFKTALDWNNSVYIDASDGWRTPSLERSFPAFRLVLRTHFNEHYTYSDTVFPWAFGLTSRIIDAAIPKTEWASRADSVLFNFRMGHPLRSFVSKNLISKLESKFPVDSRIDSFDAPLDSLNYSYWAQTGRRHYPSYFQRLVSTKICAAFGGYFSPNISKNLNSIAERACYRFVFVQNLRTTTLVQWDSWRLWEGWAAGCVVLHVDFDKYGCRFPVQPRNWVHYIGFDLDNLETGIERFLALSDDELREIGENGRAWAVEHYSPRATAERFLVLIDRHA